MMRELLYVDSGDGRVPILRLVIGALCLRVV